MLIYQVSITVQSSIAEEWTEWMKTEHIPEVMATGLFVSFRFFKTVGEDERVTQKFVVQYEAEKDENYERYRREFAAGLQRKAMGKFGAFFRAERQVIREV